MSAAGRVEAATVVSARWHARPDLARLGSTLQQAGVALEVVGSIDEAIQRIAGPDSRSQCLVLDASAAVDSGDPRAIDAVGTAIRRLREERPAIPALIVAEQPSAQLVAAAFRAGAADVIDAASDDPMQVLLALERASADHARRREREERVAELRVLVDEFLRALVRATRRTLELEDALSPDESDAETELPPRVLVVDDEQQMLDLLVEVLARIDLTPLTADTPDAALDTLRAASSRGEPIDLAIVDKNLPGMDGLELIRAMRELRPSLPVMMITGYSSADSAVAAADLGVVGYVLKPFSDVRELADRVKELAVRFAAERRERRFLARFKQRHALFLERYRRITAELDKLKR